MCGHALWKLLLSHLMALMCVEVLVHNLWWQLQDSHEEKEFSKTDNSISICISKMQYFSDPVFKFFKILSIAFNFTVIVWCKCSKEVSISHNQVTFVIFLWSECLKDFFRWTKESDLILIVSSNSISSWGLTVSCNLFCMFSCQIEIEGNERKNKFEIVSSGFECDTGTQNVVERLF